MRTKAKCLAGFAQFSLQYIMQKIGPNADDPKQSGNIYSKPVRYKLEKSLIFNTYLSPSNAASHRAATAATHANCLLPIVLLPSS